MLPLAYKEWEWGTGTIISLESGKAASDELLLKVRNVPLFKRHVIYLP